MEQTQTVFLVKSETLAAAASCYARSALHSTEAVQSSRPTAAPWTEQQDKLRRAQLRPPAQCPAAAAAAAAAAAVQLLEHLHQTDGLRFSQAQVPGGLLHPLHLLASETGADDAHQITASRRRGRGAAALPSRSDLSNPTPEALF